MNTHAEATTLSEEDALHSLDFIWLELTGKCNLECVHCYADSNPKLPMYQGLNLDDWRQTLSDAHRIGCRKVQFIGGEPTIFPHLLELIEFARALGYTFVEVFTNGTLFTDKLRNAFLGHQVSLAFSVYSSNNAIHDAVTLRNGSQGKTIESIRWALESGLPVRAAIIDVGINSGTVEATKELLREVGVKTIGIDRNRGIGRGSTNANHGNPMDELCGKCWQGKLCVTPNGDLFPCVFSRFYPLGNIHQGLSNILSSENLFSFRYKQRSYVQKEAMSSCNPQCGPDCSPAECSPQENCSPMSGCKPIDAANEIVRSHCNPDCSPEVYCAPEHDDKPDCSPMTGGCSPNER